MYANSLEKFRTVNDFPELVEYLGDELEWPIDTSDFEEMTFEYSAEELGLDHKTAPKFLEIRRLRPLDKDQPWGIFFIRFDNNTLPVVALRRLLSKLVLKKRGLASAGDRASWHENDLLLISQTGKEGAKSISFAHFASNPEKTDLPILKVLGWDDDDTGLKLDYVIETLRTKLRWPDDPTDSNAWRNQWRDAFILKNREVIQSSKEMAERLGQLALAVRTRLREVLAVESDEGPIHKLMSVFKENLISDLDTESFSDMYAQTIAYGLLSARIINPKANTADAAHTQVPITNPFLRELMDTFLNLGGRSHGSGIGLDFDELGINEVVDLLDNTNMEAVLRDFGDRNQKEDPVMHFFEGFLQAYDNKIRKDRGVFYTPQEVVSFIVHSVDEELKNEFGLEDGLADTTDWGEMIKRKPNLEMPDGVSEDEPFVQILDPAVGTGTFPVAIIEVISKTLFTKWKNQGRSASQIEELWNEYVPAHLLPRLHGFELMMAPYAIAHMKIGLKLHETGYKFQHRERAHIYLTNTLDPSTDYHDTFEFAIPSFAHEIRAVNSIKKSKHYTVIIGNPPYSLQSSNLSESQRALIDEYKYVEGTKLVERGALQLEKNLNDDYVKFIRFGQVALNKSKCGILSFVTNHSYIDNPTMRGMRYSLISTSKTIKLIDLHGNSTKKEVSPTGEIDQNVFAIKQGVAIILISVDRTAASCEVMQTDLWGETKEKLNTLRQNTFKTLGVDLFKPDTDLYLFKKQDNGLREEYLRGIPLQELMPTYGAGYITARDNLVIDFDRGTLLDRVNNFDSSTLDDDEILKSFKVSKKKGWDVRKARQRLSTLNFEDYVIPTNYRPFDNRFIFYDQSLVWGRSWPTLRHLASENSNISLIATRITKDKWNVFVARTVSSHKALSAYDTNSIFPLYLSHYDTESLLQSENSFELNLSNSLIQSITQTVFKNSESSKNNDSPSFVAEEFFYYMYGVFSTPSFSDRYCDFLKLDFPRLPITHNIDLYFELSKFGRELALLHLFESESLSDIQINFYGETNSNIQKVTFENGNIVLNPTSGFGKVTPEIWNFQLGGYRPCQKWLKDRAPKKGNEGHRLTKKLQCEYQKVLHVVSETIRINQELDSLIVSYGGWQNAFNGNMNLG